MPASTSVSGGGAGMQQDTLLGGFVARGPAIQRLLVVGPTMGGKRTFVDRLRSSSEASNTADQHDGSPPRRLHGRQPREQPQPYKTLHGVHHGCSMHFTSIAYHYSLDASRRALQGQQAAAPPSTTSASEPTISLNNTVMEVLVCDTPETLLQAMPTDPEQLLNSTAVVIALSATEVYSVSHDLGLWTKAINDAVTTVVSKHNSRVAAAKKHANSHHSGGAGSSSGGGGSGQKRPAISASAASLDLAIGTTFDIRRLSEARLDEADIAEAALGGEVKEAFLQASRSQKDWTEPAKDKSVVEGGGVPEFPESGKCLLPSLLLLSKMDVLEDVCKKPQNAAGPGTPLTAFQAAVQHSRWQALQRGAAFAAISNKGFSNATTAVFDALWRYVAFALFPQRRVQEHLKAMRRQERKKLLQTAGRHAVAAGGDDGGDSEEDAKELEEGARKEIDEAVAAARQQHRAEEGGETGSAAAESPRFFAGEESTIVNPVMNTTGGASHDQQAANYLKAIITSNTIKSSLNAVASQTVFIPKGLDDPTWLYNESFPSRWLHMYAVFKAIRTSTTEAGGADDNREPSSSSSSHANKHPGRARLELFAKIMADALGASALPNNNSVSSPVTSQSMTPMPTAAAVAASNSHHQESATTSTSDAPAVATANSSVSAGGGTAAASTSQPPPASSGGGADGAAPAGDDELVWDEL